MHDMFALVNDILSEEVIDGLDRAVLNMKKGEVALVTIPPEYAFGSTESKQDLAVVPPNSTVVYEVELVSFVKVCVRLSVRYFSRYNP
jgi:FKBP-type peptidyl-prolyl cis-trans isomerase